jgi:hypothetical protein
MELEDLLLWPQEPASGPYLEPDEHLRTYFMVQDII